MAEKNDGGAAFPSPERKASSFSTEYGGEIVTRHIPPQQGMSLRDYAAFKALPIADEDYGKTPVGEIKGRKKEDMVAEIAYRYADAMLRAREASHD